MALPRYRLRSRRPVNYVGRDSPNVGVPLGDGLIDYATFFDTLIATGYTRTRLAYELCYRCETAQTGQSTPLREQFKTAWRPFVAKGRRQVARAAVAR